MIYFKYCLQVQTPLAMHYRQSKLNPKKLHDLHNGQASIEEAYLRKMSQSATHGCLRGDL
jgi:penicillin-binding protein-related factor A (putative recombinase)